MDEWKRVEDVWQGALRNPIWKNRKTGQKIRAKNIGGIKGSEWEAVLMDKDEWYRQGEKIAHCFNKDEILDKVKQKLKNEMV